MAPLNGAPHIGPPDDVRFSSFLPGPVPRAVWIVAQGAGCEATALGRGGIEEGRVPVVEQSPPINVELPRGEFHR